MVGRDRTDVLLVDLVLIGDVTAVANEDGSSELLIQHRPHLTLEPGDDIEVDDVEHVITIQLLLLVDRGRGGDSLGDGEELLLLQGTGDVTLRTSLGLGDVGERRLHTGEGALASAVQDASDPLHPPRQELGGGAVDELRIGEQLIDVGDAVCQSVALHSVLQRSQLRRVGDDALDVGVREDDLLGLLSVVLLLEDVATRHVFTFLVGVGVLGFVVGIVFCSGECLSEHVMEYLLLLLGHGVVDVLDRLAFLILFGLGVLDVVLGLLILVFELEGIELQTGVDDGLVFEGVLRPIGMLNRDTLDESAGVGARKHQTDLTNHAVHDSLRSLEEVVCPDGHHLHIAVLHCFCSVPSLGRLVEETVPVDAILTMLEDDMSEDALRISVSVLPDERHLHLVLVSERIRQDGSSVGALQARLGDVATEIRFHFDFLS